MAGFPLKISPRGLELGFATSNIMSIILALVAGVIIVATMATAGDYMAERWGEFGGEYGGFFMLGSADYLIKPLLTNMERPIRIISEELGDALEDMADEIMYVVKGFFVVIGAIVGALVGAVLSPFMGPLGYEVGVAVYVGIYGTGVHISEQIGGEFDEVIAALNDIGLDDDGIVNAEMIGRKSKVIIRGTAPDVSALLAGEIESCLKLGQDPSNSGFLICRDSVVIKRAGEDTCSVPTGTWFDSTDECSVTWMLTALYEWGDSPKKSNKICGHCDVTHGRDAPGYCAEVMIGSDSRFHESDLVDWEEDACGDGIIEEGEECLLKVYYGYDGKVHVRAQ